MMCFYNYFDHVLFNRDGSCVISVGQSLQYHCDWQQWASIPEHAGSGGRQNNNDGNSCNCLHPTFFFFLPTGHSVYPSFLLFLQMLSEYNIKFYMNDIVTEIKGVNGKVRRNASPGYFITTFVLSLVKKVKLNSAGVWFTNRWRKLCLKVEKLSQRMCWLWELVR